MKFTYYGHACFLVEISGKKVLFDPFITPNELAKHINIKEIEADYVLVSHGHEDHVADCKSIAKRTNATVVGGFEVCEWLNKNGVENSHSMNHGGKWKFDFGTVRCTNSIHSSVMPDGKYGGNPMGFLITSAEKNFYYSGDTALTMDMQLIPRWAKLDFAVLAIGDNYTMGYEDAIEAAKMIQCNTVVGVHYDTFEYIKLNKQQAKDAFSAAGLTLHLPGIGESIDM
jgi:L-ascorbate metabolism protein UlaG (beta-lactamase superfamily)